MAVTKLMNIKSSPHGAGRHLYNSIRYIINPDKTEGGLYVGGNSGDTADDIYRVMINTKDDWDKRDGRQGYHFVLSWKPGEVNADGAYRLVREFCEEYLGDNYDYVFSIHTDQAHTHGHIVFNSVSRQTGYKYRYEKGDWEKYIQPITDKICARNGIAVLEYEKDNKVGKSYAEHYAEKEGGYTWKKIIQSDIDYVVSCSESWEDFLDQMRQIGYTFPRQGIKQKIGEYITFCAPGGHRRRSDSLGAGYSVREIKERIMLPVAGRTERIDLTSPNIRHCRTTGFQTWRPLTQFQKKYVKKYIRAATFFSRRNPYAVNQKTIRRDLIQIDKLRADCHYVLENNIRSISDLDQRTEEIRAKEKRLKEKQAARELFTGDTKVKEYLDLTEQLRQCTDPSDNQFEMLQDQIEKLETEIPKGVEEIVRQSYAATDHLKKLRDEKRIVRHIKNSFSKSENLTPVKMVSKKTDKKILNPDKKGMKWKQR